MRSSVICIYFFFIFIFWDRDLLCSPEPLHFPSSTLWNTCRSDFFFFPTHSQALFQYSISGTFPPGAWAQRSSFILAVLFCPTSVFSASWLLPSVHLLCQEFRLQFYTLALSNPVCILPGGTGCIDLHSPWWYWMYRSTFSLVVLDLSLCQSSGLLFTIRVTRKGH